MPLYRAADADIETIVGIVNHAYRGTDGWTHEGDYIDGQRTDARTLRADQANAPGAFLLTLREEPESEILGVVWLEPQSGSVWYLGMLTVRPDLQASRLGRGLLEQAEVFAQHRGARRLRMTVVSVRETLIAWYERRGYRLTGETEPFPYDDERFGRPKRDDLVFVVLEKALPAGAG